MNCRREEVLREQIMSNHEFGRYTGRLVLDSSSSSRQTKTTSDFGFLDNEGRHWPVPAGTAVDGASIPKALWFLFGDRWEGKYREAIAVHDYYCAVRSTDWRSVHRVFYYAMLASSVSVRRAKLVYAGVYFAGPRWGDAAVGSLQTSQLANPPPTSPANTLYALCRDPVALAVSEAIKCNGRSAFDWITSEQHPDNWNSQISLGLDALSDMVQEDDPPLRELEVAIDYAVSLIPCHEGASRAVSVGRTSLLD
jgi:Protein of unknown function (DUF1353)